MAYSQSLADERHPWTLDPNAAAKWQSLPREPMVLSRAAPPVSCAGGIDASGSGQARAAILAAWAKRSGQPDLALFDRQGTAHPRGIGIAADMGLWLNRPSIGVATSRLYGHHLEPGHGCGDHAELLSQRQPPRVIGAIMRTRARTNPLYISPGHVFDTPHPVEFVLACVTRYRLPVLTRWAHKVAGGNPLPSAAAANTI
jgi:deoxyribonuclease V